MISFICGFIFNCFFSLNSSLALSTGLIFNKELWAIIYVTSFSSISNYSKLRLISNMLYEQRHLFYTFRHPCFHNLAFSHSFFPSSHSAQTKYHNIFSVHAFSSLILIFWLHCVECRSHSDQNEMIWKSSYIDERRYLV